MNSTERDFYNDIEDAISDWDYNICYYHDDNYGNGNLFCIDIHINDEDVDMDEVWDAVKEVTDDWGAGIDESMNEIYVCLDLDDD